MCGCGAFTRLAPLNDRSKGWVKGEPLKYIKGHHTAASNKRRGQQARGSRSNANGYAVVNTGPRERQYEHILIAERALGRPLKQISKGHPDNEVVHHVYGKDDNANLVICSHSYHTALHARLEASPLWPEFPMRVRRPDLAKGCST